MKSCHTEPLIFMYKLAINSSNYLHLQTPELPNISQVQITTQVKKKKNNLPKRVDLRRRHHAMLARMKKAPHRPPKTPRRMKGMSSNRYHGVWYST